MGLFNQRINIKKEFTEEGVTIYVDYHKRKNPRAYCDQLVQELVGSNACLVVIDTGLSYQRPELNSDEMNRHLFAALDLMGVNYHKIMTQREEELSVFGIAVKTKQKKLIVNYLIGFILTPTELMLLEKISDYFNLQYYILQHRKPDEMLEQFKQLHSDMGALNQLEDFNLYQDNFFHRLRIHQRLEEGKQLEVLLQRYTEC